MKDDRVLLLQLVTVTTDQNKWTNKIIVSVFSEDIVEYRSQMFTPFLVLRDDPLPGLDFLHLVRCIILCYIPSRKEKYIKSHLCGPLNAI